MPPLLSTLQSLFSLPQIESLCLLLAALLLAWQAPLPAQYQPWQLLRLLADGINKRVNKPQHSANQLRLSGCLAILIVVLPLLAFWLAFRQLSDWPVALDAIMLYLCLDAGSYERQARQALAHAKQGQLQLAREQLQPHLLRDCSQLSLLGFCKATIEMVVQRQARHYAVILCWFLLLGAPGAIVTRLLLELRQSWNSKLKQNQHFGAPLAQLVFWQNAAGLWLYACLVALLYRLSAAMQYYRFSADGWLSRPERWLLCAWSAALQRNLAGPLIYQQEKLRRVRIGPATAPDLDDVELCLRISRQIQLTVLLLLLSGLGLTLLWHWPS